jgi:Flp pilus assembly protein TadB
MSTMTTRHAPTYPDQESLREEAVQSLKRKRDFRNNLFAYFVVNGFLLVVWLVVALTAGPWFFWPVFPLAGWGIGLIFHWRDAYRHQSITQEDVAREMQRLRTP